MSTHTDITETPDWAAFLGAGYAEFRRVLVDVLADAKLEYDAEHVDCGVLHTSASGTLGLANIARLCHAAPIERWRDVIANHLRLCMQKAPDLGFDIAGPRLRVRLVPERHVAAQPDRYVTRRLANDLHLALAIDKPEHVVFVAAKEPPEWGQSIDALFELAMANTRAEPALDRTDLELPDGPRIVGLFGSSYYAASHAMFLERYVAPGEHGHVIAVPDRHALLAFPFGGDRDLGGLGPLVKLAHVRFSEEPGAISDQIYWRRREGTLVKIACGVRADGQPWVAPPEAFTAIVTGN
jgi:hypothetical protein